MLSLLDLSEEQRLAADWLATRTEAFVILPVGFGKTIIALTAIKEIMDVYAELSRPTPRTLVVSTKAICELTWGQEIEKWEHLQGLTYQSAAGRRREALEARPDVLGINFESLEWLLDRCDADPALLPEMLVIDESSKMKDNKAGRVKRLAGFGGAENRGYVHRFARRWNLTATPTPEGFVGLWSQEACISMHRRLGQNITAFRNEFCTQAGEREHGKYVVSKHSRAAIMDRLSPITFVTDRDKYDDRPPAVHSAIEVPWTDEGRAIYDELEESFGMDLSDYLETIGDDDELEDEPLETLDAGSVAVLLSKLRQACSGFVYDGRGHARRLDDSRAKLRALETLRDRVGDAPILVFFQFRAEAEALASHFGERVVVGLPSSLEDWNQRRIPLLAVHPASCSHGVNLQYGSSVACWFSLPWSYEHWHQGNGRLDRRGQEEQVSIVRLVRPNSIEQDIYKKLLSKEGGVREFIHGIRERREQAHG